MKHTILKTSIVLTAMLATGFVTAEENTARTSSLSTTNSFDLSGFRVGGGFGIVDASDSTWDNHDTVVRAGYYDEENTDADKTLFIEMGYDVNGIVGVSAAIGKGSVSYFHETGREATPIYNKQANYTYSKDLDYTFLKVATDLGYTFKLTRTQSLKPYVKVGFSVNDLEVSTSKNHYNSNRKVEKNGYDGSETAIVTGLGLRYTMDHVFYADIAYEKSNIQFADLSTINLSAGYKF